MSDTKELKVGWVKITTTMFDDEKIKVIDSLPDRDALLIIWVKLIAQAGKCNARGFIFLTENIPFTPETLATVFNRPPNTVRLALETFQKLGMLEWDGTHLALVNWEKHQNIEGLERIKEQDRLRVAKFRNNQKKLLSNGNVTSVTDNVNVTPCNALESSISLSLSSSYGTKNIPILLAEKLRGFILSNNPKARTPSLLDKWAKIFDLMMRIDKRTEEEIMTVMTFSQLDSFWKTNILSPDALRRQFDRLTLQQQSRNGSGYKSISGNRLNQSQIDDIERLEREGVNG